MRPQVQSSVLPITIEEQLTVQWQESRGDKHILYITKKPINVKTLSPPTYSKELNER